ncbi:MAG TPA: hypothetical protein VIO61_04275 [Anaerolineaceae bacterium]
MTAKASKSFQLDVPFEAGVVIARNVLTDLRINIIQLDPNSGIIRAKKNMSWVSWGEMIDVRITPFTGGCQVWIESHCMMPTQIVDWGANANNVKNFETRLYAHLQAYRQQNPTSPSPTPSPVTPAPDSGRSTSATEPPALIHLRCPACSGPLQADEGNNLWVCTYCGNKYARA